MDSVMPVAGCELTWRKTPSMDIIADINEEVTPSGLLEADDRGIIVTFENEWEDWKKFKKLLEFIAEYIQANHCALNGGLFLYTGSKQGKYIIPKHDYGKKYRLVGGKLKPSTTRVHAVRQINRRR